MASHPFEAYCSAVCSLVRWKRYRAAIAAELTAHMEDHADCLAAKGMTQEDAAAQAVAAMGDPYTVGRELDKLHSPWWPRLTRIFMALSAVFLLATLTIWLLRAPAPPVLNPAELLREGRYNTDTVLTVGHATGGGRLGAYTFSDGAAALCQYTDESGSPAYRLKFVLPSRTACFWLDTPKLSWIPGRLDDAAYPYISTYYVNAHGLFSHFSGVSVPVTPPFRSAYTFAFGPGGEAAYTVTLEEVPNP